MQQSPFFSGSGFVYRDGKKMGRRSGIEFHHDALFVIKSGVGGTVASIAGGSLAGSLADHASVAKAKADGKLEIFPYAEAVSIGIDKSLFNGKGIRLTMADGRSVKLKPQYASISKLYDVVRPAVAAANPGVRVE